MKNIFYLFNFILNIIYLIQKIESSQNNDSDEKDTDDESSNKTKNKKYTSLFAISKLMGTYSLSSIGPVSKALWKKITNNSKNGLIIKLSGISDANRVECKNIANGIIELVSNKLERKTAFEKCSKTALGYTFQMRCFIGTRGSRNACPAHWSVRVNIVTNEIHVYCTNLCNHQLSEVPGRFSKLLTKKIISFY